MKTFKTLDDLHEYSNNAFKQAFGSVEDIRPENPHKENYWETLKFKARPHDVFKLDWSTYNSIRFANTFLPYVSGIKGKGLWMYDGAELFNDLKKAERKLFKFDNHKELISLINYTYPKGVLIAENKNRVQIAEHEILTFIEVDKNDTIDIQFKLGKRFKEYLKNSDKSLNVSQLENQVYKTDVSTFKSFFNQKIVHFNMMQYIFKLFDIEVEPSNDNKNEEINKEATKDKVYAYKACSEDITLEQIEELLLALDKKTNRRLANAKSVLPYINAYRKTFQLDSCLRKAHFFAQVLVESNYFHTFSESGHYQSTQSMPGVFSTKEKIVDTLILNSLFSNLTDIFEFRDKNNKIIKKTNKEIKTIILAEKIKESDKKLYGRYRGIKEGEKRKEKLLKDVKETVTVSGVATEQTKYKIYLKIHSAFEVPLLSRAYASIPRENDLGNGNEYSRDGWKYKGRGLKQVTGRYNYNQFTKFRNKNTFPNDKTGNIDFTDKENKNATSVETKLDGNYLKLSDNTMYATQSAFWYWFDKKYKKKHCYEYADLDHVYYVTVAINGGTNNFKERKEALLAARKTFKVYDYYRETFKNGTIEQKKSVRENLERITFTRKYLKSTVEGDKEAGKVLREINKPIEVKAIGIKPISNE